MLIQHRVECLMKLNVSQRWIEAKYKGLRKWGGGSN